jgi:hypothetical protein
LTMMPGCTDIRTKVLGVCRREGRRSAWREAKSLERADRHASRCWRSGDQFQGNGHHRECWPTLHYFTPCVSHSAYGQHTLGPRNSQRSRSRRLLAHITSPESRQGRAVSRASPAGLYSQRIDAQRETPRSDQLEATREIRQSPRNPPKYPRAPSVRRRAGTRRGLRQLRSPPPAPATTIPIRADGPREPRLAPWSLTSPRSGIR